MTERRTIGQILMDLGRIDAGDVAKALEFQRDNGGYFGEALVGCGFVSTEELEWGLASQFDLPYVFPDADSIDPEAAAMVTPEWALSNLTLPIMRTDRTLTVIVESPIDTKGADELRTKTELQVELALASPSKIRELIRTVFARGSAAEESRRQAPVSLSEGFGSALGAGSARFGVSTRGHRSWFWWDDGGTIRRSPLDGMWASELEKLASPPPSIHVVDKLRATWQGELSRSGMLTPVEVQYLADESGHEYLFRPLKERSVLQERFQQPVSGILAEIRLLARSGSARFVVTTDPPALGHQILPHLPALLLDPSWRSIYINAGEQEAAAEAFSARMPEDSSSWSSELDALRAFHFDVVTVDLTGNESDWAGSALDVASVAFLLWPATADHKSAYDAGIRWVLHIAREEEGQLDWSLEPLHV